jgi:hypothetical protein
MLWPTMWTAGEPEVLEQGHHAADEGGRCDRPVDLRRAAVFLRLPPMTRCLADRVGISVAKVQLDHQPHPAHDQLTSPATDPGSTE